MIFHNEITHSILLRSFYVANAFILGAIVGYILFDGYIYYIFNNREILDDESIVEPTNLYVANKVGKRDQQHQVILAVIDALGYEPLKIPTGGKSKVRDICLMRVKVFTESAFDHAWKDGTNLGLFRLLESEKFSPKQ